MEKKVVVLGNKGMYQDSAVSKSSDEFAFENYNIRITAVNDETLFAVTNEKGSTPIKVTIEGDPTPPGESSDADVSDIDDNVIVGKYLGRTILGNSLVLFTKYRDWDWIWKITEDEDNANALKAEILYVGYLNFSAPIEAIGYYESESVQKVYFVDGINPNRVINIAKTYVCFGSETDIDAQFDFVPSVSKLPTVTIEKTYGGNGMFPAGTVQYFISYFNKLGAETKIIWASDLQYASFKDRGAKADEIVNCNFNLTINNVDENFEYIRVYSAKRTSIDGPLDVAIVAEVPISGASSVTVVDNNIDIIAQDSSILQFVGGDAFIASTIEQKDNVAFFGDLKILDISLDDLKSQIQAGIDLSFARKEISDTEGHQLIESQKSICGFKGGEYYRVGVQFQNLLGEWSNPIFIRDIKNTIYPLYDGETCVVPFLVVTNNFSNDLISELRNAGFVSYRAVIVEPSPKYRTILAQGIINPTVFGYKDRMEGGFYARPSWITRPLSLTGDGISNFRHLTSISDTGNSSHSAELQSISMSMKPGGNNIVVTEPSYTLNLSERFKPINTLLSVYTYDITCSLIKNINDDKTAIDTDYANNTRQQSTEFTITSFSKQSNKIDRKAILRESYSAIKKWLADTFGVKLEDFILQEAFVNRSFNTAAQYKIPGSDYYFVSSASAGFNRNVIISDVTFYDNQNITIYDYFKVLNTDELIDVDVDNLKDQYYVDQSILTLDSPDIEKIDSLYEDTKLSIVGATMVETVTTDYQLTVDNGGEYSENLKKAPSNYLQNSPVYRGYAVYPSTSQQHAGEYKSDKDNDYYIYLWNKQGSINGETNLASGQIDFHSVLKHKIFSNYTRCTKWCTALYPEAYTFPNDNGYSAILCEPETNMVRFKSGNTYSPKTDILAISGNGGYTVNSILKETTQEYRDPVKTWDPVRIKYTCPKHIAFELGTKYYTDAEQYDYFGRLTLPYVYTSDEVDVTYGDTETTEWKKDYYSQVDQSIPAVFATKDIFPWETIKYIKDNLIIDAGIPNPDFLSVLETSFLYIGEIKKVINGSLYGDTTESVLDSQTWIPASLSKPIDENITDTYGDTYFQRWECLRAYPTTEEDENSVVDVVSFMVESHINLDGRCDVNRGPYNLNLKRPTNTNLMNEAYSQKDNIFAYKILDEDQFGNKKYPNQFTWSLAKSPMQLVDTWTNATLTNVEVVDGQYGPIREICKLNDSLFVFQDRAICVINFNNRTQISTEQGLPIELANSGKVQGVTYLTKEYGCNNKYSIVNTKTGIYFIDSINKKFLKINKDGINDVSTVGGMSIWFKKHITDTTAVWSGEELTNKTFVCHYDPYRGDIYIITASDCLIYNEQLETFTSFFTTDYQYNSKALFGFNGESYTLVQKTDCIEFNRMFAGDYTNDYSITYRVNPEPLVNKMFTNGEYIADFTPNVVGPDTSEQNDTITAPFDTIRAWTEYQDTGEQSLETKLPNWKHDSVKPKFRVKRFDIPQVSIDANKKWKKDRISNPWVYLKLWKTDSTTPSNKEMQFHSLAVTYYR